MTKKLLCFIDETGSPNLDKLEKEDYNSKIFGLNTVLVDTEKYIEVVNIVNHIKIKYTNTEDIILHGKKIKKQEGDFEFLLDKSVEEGFLSDLVILLDSLPVEIYAAGINKRRYVERYLKKMGVNPHGAYEFCLGLLLERIGGYMKFNGYNEAVIICESRQGQQDLDLESAFYSLIDGSTHMTTINRGLFNKFDIRLVFKEKHKNIVGLQISDLFCYSLGQYILGNVNNPTMEIFLKKLCGGERYGIKVYP